MTRPIHTGIVFTDAVSFKFKPNDRSVERLQRMAYIQKNAPSDALGGFSALMQFSELWDSLDNLERAADYAASQGKGLVLQIKDRNFGSGDYTVPIPSHLLKFGDWFAGNCHFGAVWRPEYIKAQVELCERIATRFKEHEGIERVEWGETALTYSAGGCSDGDYTAALLSSNRRCAEALSEAGIWLAINGNYHPQGETGLQELFVESAYSGNLGWTFPDLVPSHFAEYEGPYILTRDGGKRYTVAGYGPARKIGNGLLGPVLPHVETHDMRKGQEAEAVRLAVTHMRACQVVPQSVFTSRRDTDPAYWPTYLTDWWFPACKELIEDGTIEKMASNYAALNATGKDSLQVQAPEITTDVSFIDEGNIKESPTAEGDSSEGGKALDSSGGSPSAALRLPGPYAKRKTIKIGDVDELQDAVDHDCESIVLTDSYAKSVTEDKIHTMLVSTEKEALYNWQDDDGTIQPLLIVSEAALAGRDPISSQFPSLPPLVIADGTYGITLAGVSLARGLDRRQHDDKARPLHIGYDCGDIRLTRFELRDWSDGIMVYPGIKGFECDHYVIRDQQLRKGEITDVVAIGFAGKARDRKNGKRSMFRGVKLRKWLFVNGNDHAQLIGDGDGSIPEWDDQASAPGLLIEDGVGLVYPDQYVIEGGVEKMPFENLIADFKFGSHDPNRPVVVRNTGAKGARPTASWGGSGGHGYPIDMHFAVENVVIDGLRLEDCCNGVGMVGKVRNIIAKRGVMSGIKQLGDLTTTGHGITVYAEKGNTPENIYVQEMIFADVDKPVANNRASGEKRCDTLTVTGSHRAGSTPEIASYMMTESSQQLAAISPGSEAFNRLTESASTDMIAEAWNYARKPIFDDYTDEEIGDETIQTDVPVDDSTGSEIETPAGDDAVAENPVSEAGEESGGVDIDLGDDLSGDAFEVMRGISQRMSILEESFEPYFNRLIDAEAEIEELKAQNEALARWLTAAPITDEAE